MSPIATASSPKLWKHLFGALIALLVLIPLWTLFVARVIQPESFILNEEQSMNSAWIWPVVKWGVLLPMAVVTLVFGAWWTMMARNAQVKQQQPQMRTQQVTASDQAKREYVLEVIGLGVTLDKYRQGKLWEALQAGSPYITIREQDKEKYEWSAQDKVGLGGSRGGDSLENGAQYTPMYYGVPVFNAESPILNPARADKPNSPLPGLAGGAVPSGMAWHLFVTGPRRFDEHPDRILEDVFAFFDSNPDVPYIVLNTDDGMGRRDSYRPPDAPELLRDGYYIPEMPDSSALFVLARRERVDPVRPFVWDDPDNEFVQKIFRWMYGELMESVPHPRRTQITRTPAQVGADPIRHESADPAERQPLVAEWLEAAAAFAQRPDIRGTGVVGMLGDLNLFSHHPSKEWKPTPWFPIPWNKDQLATFDRLPTLGFIHRPTFVRFLDEHGKPLTRRDEREKAMQAGWQAALQTLPEAQRAGAPARIVAATGGNTDQLVVLHATLNAHVARGGPEIDSGKSSQFIDTDRRLGNTGATTLFMQMAIGVMGSYRDGGISAAVNLRDLNEASIVLISPPSDDKRKMQKHPNGGDVFAHHGSPAIDPNNYK
jgi:hypothetical protein